MNRLIQTFSQMNLHEEILTQLQGATT